MNEVTHEELLRKQQLGPRTIPKLIDENEELIDELRDRLNQTDSRLEKNMLRARIEGRKRLIRELDGML